MANGLFDDVRKKFQAGTLLGGRGALGSLLGLEARKAAQNKAIMQAGLGLLAQGPSRTPISFGQSMAGSLLGAQGAYDKALGGELNDLVTMKSLSAITKPEYKTMNIEGVGDVMVDVNPQSPTFKQQISPTTLLSSNSLAAKPVEIMPTTKDIADVPLIEDAAQRDAYGRIAKLARGVAGVVGQEVAKETTTAEYFVENLNKDLRLNLVQDLGGRLTKVVSDELNKILPNPALDNNVEFKVKAEELVKFSEKRISEITSQLPSMTLKERKNAASLIQSLSSKIKSYKAMLEKQKQFDSGTGIYAKTSNEDLIQEYSQYETSP